MDSSRPTTPETLRDRYERMVRGDTPRPRTVSELVAAYLAHCKATYPARAGKPSSTHSNARDATSSLLVIYPDVQFAEVGAVQIQAARLFMIDQSLSRRTINDRCARIRTMYRWAMERGWIGPEVVEGLKVAGLRKNRSAARETPKKKVVAIELVLRTLRDRRLSKTVKDMVRFQLRTGARPGDVVSIRGAEVDDSQSPWVYEPASGGKMSWLERDTVVLIGPRAQLILIPRMNDGYLFLTRLGTPYTVNSYRWEIQKACSRLGIPKWSPQLLRKRTATEAAKQSETAARDILGHADVRTTRQHYIDARHSTEAVKFAESFG